jgi:hypothetical protein
LLNLVDYKGIKELKYKQTGPFGVRETRNELSVQRVVQEGISLMMWQNCPASSAVKLQVRAVGCIKCNFM